jgi:SAM-dependent methyltransferase
MKRDKCTICNYNLQNIYILDNLPKKLSCVNFPIYDLEKLSFSKCIQCNTIQLDHLIPLDILYSDSHNYTSVGKVWENYFKLFINKIEPIIKNKNILEIGDPSGKIALNANEYNKWYIVEPNKNSNIVFDKNIFFIEQFFDDNFKIDDKIDMIVHSHLFEHIYEPNKFLKNCHNILSNNGEMFFGVPNMQHFSESDICPFLGVFFEHTIFLNKENITYLLENNHFEVIEIIDYENHSTLYHCKKLNIPQVENQQFEYQNNNQLQTQSQFKITDYYDSFTRTIGIYKDFIEKCNNIIKNTKKEVYIFGASYNSQFLISLGLELQNITGILDNCKEKQEKYFYGYNLKIYNPNIIQNKDCIIILKNGYYVNEISKQIYDLNMNTVILI